MDATAPLRAIAARIMPHVHYGRYVLRHKYYVYKAGRALQLGRWRLLKHDWTKFLPIEWFAYVERFHGPNAYKPEAGSKGYLHQEGQDTAFDRAWRHHWMRNSHHWQYHTDQHPQTRVFITWFNEHTSGPPLTCVPMPYDDVLELVADWWAAGRAQNKPDLLGWYAANKDKITLHERTRPDVERLIGWLSEVLP